MIIYTVFATCPIFLVIHFLAFGVNVWILKDAFES